MSDLVERKNKRGGKREGSGRKPGTPNKMTASVKDAISKVAENLGGTERMTAWVQEDPANEKAFWTVIYPKLLPVQMANSEGGDLFESFHKIAREIVRPNDKDS